MPSEMIDPKTLNPSTIRVRKLSASATLPTLATPGAAGWDLYASECTSIPAGGWAAVPTGLAMALPSYFEAQIRPRSGLAFKKGITVLNAPGTIDSDYRGEVKVLLINHGKEDHLFYVGDRIAQMVIATCLRTEFYEVAALDETERGSGGFGSTGT